MRLVERERPTTYYGRPIVKRPVWKPEIPWYFFFGGLAGASANLAAAATFAGRHRLARRAWLGALVGVTVSPALLISDLGKPSRFLNMLRVFKVTSPMSLGAWLLAANGAATTLAAVRNLREPRRRGGAAEVGAALLGAPLATYTAALITNSAIPAWAEARFEIPFVFGASAAASAAGAALLSVPAEETAPARALGVGAVLVEEAAGQVMERRLGPLAESYKRGVPGRFDKLARGLNLAGALAITAAGGGAPIPGRRPPIPGRRRPGIPGRGRPAAPGARGRRALAGAGGALLLAGSICRRWAVYKAGIASAEDPEQTIGPQRARIARDGGGA